MTVYYHFNKQGDFMGTVESPSSKKLLSMPMGDTLIPSGEIYRGQSRTMWMRSASMELHASWPQVYPHNFPKDIYGKIASTLLVMGVDKIPSIT